MLHNIFRTTWVTIIARALLLIAPATPAYCQLSLAEFTDCIGPNVGGYGSTCTLALGTYSIDSSSTLLVSRSNITVQGSGTWPSDLPVLQRADDNGEGSAYSIMSVTGTGDLIQDFTIDGHRDYSTYLNCNNSADNSWVDLDAFNGENIQIQDMYFENSPYFSLSMADGESQSSPNWSYVYQSEFINNRKTGVYAETNNIIDYNTFEYNGGGAINIGAVSGTLTEYNYLLSSQDEWLFGVVGGQLVAFAGASSGTVIDNYMDADNANCPYPGCTVAVNGSLPGCSVATPPGGLQTVGIEEYASDFTFTNNELTNGSGGMDNSATSNITINGVDPSWTQYYIENNTLNGGYAIWFYDLAGSNSGSFQFNSVQSKNNSNYGFNWDDTTSGVTLTWGSGATAGQA